MSLFVFVYLLLTGFGLGLLISAPVGPVNILCIQHSLSRGFWAGFATGFGAVIADMMIATMAVMGLTAISGIMQSYEGIIQLVGGAILFVFGLRLLLSHPKMIEPTDASLHPFRHLGAVPQSFLLTITNPGALLGIFAVVGSAGTAIGGIANFSEAFLLLVGILSGGVLWWAVLARVVSLFRRQMSEARLLLINRCAGGLLLICGVGLMVRGLFF